MLIYLQNMKVMNSRMNMEHVRLFLWANNEKRVGESKLYFICLTLLNIIFVMNRSSLEFF